MNAVRAEDSEDPMSTGNGPELAEALEEREGIELGALVDVARAIWEDTCDLAWEDGSRGEYEAALDTAESAIEAYSRAVSGGAGVS